MLTAQDKLNQALISWYTLLSGWSLDGSLASTAEHVLNLEGENAIEGADDLLQSYTSQWSLGDFESLPPIVLLSNEDISGARGAYAASTDTIYLNEDWLLTASEEDIIAVLTEELGAFLDDQLNTADTQGDEGALFSAGLLGIELSDAEVAAIQQEDDSVQIVVDGLEVEAEAFEAVNNLSSALSIDFDGDLIQDTSPLNSPVTVIGEVSIANSQGLFNGIDSGLRVDSSSIDMSKDFSISLNLIWDQEDDNNLTPIIDKRQIGLGPGGWSLRVINGSISWEGASSIDGNYVFYAPIERDYQHTVEVNRIGGMLQFAVDGIVIDTKYDPTDYTNNNPINIGNNKDFNSTFGASYFQGMMDNISIKTGEINYSEYFSEPLLRGDSLYELVKTNASASPEEWITLRQASQDLGGDLLKIESLAENDFIIEAFTGLVPTLYIGLKRVAPDEFAWVDGEVLTTSSYTNWGIWRNSDLVEPVNPDHDYVLMSMPGGDIPNVGIAPGEWGVTRGIWYSVWAPEIDAAGVAELTLNSSIDFSTAIEGQDLTTTFNLSAGTSNHTDLVEGAHIYYEVTGGIDSDDLDNTSPNGLTGSGTIQNGQLSLDFALKDDGIAENETLSITFYSDATLSAEYQIGSTASVEIVDSTPPAVIGTATSDAALTIISGNSINPLVESYEITTTGKGKKNRVTTGTFTDVLIDQTSPLDALVVNGGDSDNTITANGFVDNESTEIDETRSAFTGVLVIDGKGGADTIIGGASGTNWLIGGGTSDDSVDTLTGVSLAKDIFDLRKQDDVSGEIWSDAYSAGGHAEIRNYNIGDFIVLSGLAEDYEVINKTSVTETAKGKSGKTKSESTTIFEITKDGDLVAQIYGSDFDANSQSSALNLIYGQSTGSLFDLVLNEATGQTILG